MRSWHPPDSDSGSVQYDESIIKVHNDAKTRFSWIWPFGIWTISISGLPDNMLAMAWVNFKYVHVSNDCLPVSTLATGWTSLRLHVSNDCLPVSTLATVWTSLRLHVSNDCLPVSTLATVWTSLRLHVSNDCLPVSTLATVWTSLRLHVSNDCLPVSTLATVWTNLQLRSCPG